MNKLIIINGPCGIGKSTVAKKVHGQIPLAYLVDVDEIGRRISQYQKHEEKRREIRETVAYATVDAAFSAGVDVVVEKMIFEDEVLDNYVSIGDKHGAVVIEIILWAPKDIVVERADARGYREGGTFTREKCERFWEEINELKDRRPNAAVIDVTELSEDAVFQEVIQELDTKK